MSIEDIRDRIPPEWGKWIQVGPGWYDIITSLDNQLAEIDPDYTVHQVKEKFGGLRYYFSTDKTGHEVNAMNELIRIAERQAAHTCEDCGGLGTLRDDGWMQVLCDECEEAG